MDFRELQSRLSKMAPVELAQVADATKISVHTIAKVASGETENPRIKTVEKIAKYFRGVAA